MYSKSIEARARARARVCVCVCVCMCVCVCVCVFVREREVGRYGVYSIASYAHYVTDRISDNTYRKQLDSNRQ